MAQVASVNLRRIASEAGVSHMTVSRVLRGGGKVAAETCERVRKVAETLGYRPNPLVQAYAAQVRLGRASGELSRCNLAWLASNPESRGRPHAWAQPLLTGAKEGADGD